MSYKLLKLKLRVFLAGHFVAMVTYCATQLTATRSPMIGQFVDTMILASTDKEWFLSHQTVSLGKYWKLFLTTLSTLYKARVEHQFQILGNDMVGVCSGLKHLRRSAALKCLTENMPL